MSWGILLKILGSLYIDEALKDHSSEISITLDELSGVLALSKWSKIFVIIAWLCIFSIKAAFLCVFYILLRQLSRHIYMYFWFVVFFNVACYFTLQFLDWAICPHVGEKAGKSVVGISAWHSSQSAEQSHQSSAMNTLTILSASLSASSVRSWTLYAMS